jgi:hypothetical protein
VDNLTGRRLDAVQLELADFSAKDAKYFFQTAGAQNRDNLNLFTHTELNWNLSA